MVNQMHYVLLTTALLKLVQKRLRLSKDRNIWCSSMVHAMEELSPFLVLDLDKDEVASGGMRTFWSIKNTNTAKTLGSTLTGHS